ncbi:MAG TPA: hypothetical protein VFV54_11780, partial [Thermoanaerobaculia bacterium]|nr:hypothetical protein [Thermoanaerobaculia bacterium]
KSTHFRPTDWPREDLILLSGDSAGGVDVFAIAPDGRGGPKPILASKFYESGASLSPDGKWIAYTSNESGKHEVFLQAFPGPGGKTQVSVGGGNAAEWSHSGREIFYISGENLMVASVETTPRLRVSRPRRVFEKEMPGYRLDKGFEISPDDRRLLLVKSDPARQLAHQMILVLHWDDELRRRVPAR